MRIGIIGLGNMGFAMASRLIHTKHDVMGWNRSPEPLQRLVEMGGQRARSVADVFERDVAITMLATDEATRATIPTDVLRKAKKGLVHIMSATISVDYAKELAKLHTEAGVAFLSAPVLGRPNMAAEGGLAILAAGSRDVIDRVKPVLDTLGRRVFHVGDKPHSANVAKLACNFALASAIQTMSEAFVLTERYGIATQTMAEIFTETLFAAPAYRVYAPMLAQKKFEPAGFELRLGLKDVRQAVDAGEEAGVPMSIASVLRDNFVDAMAHGDGEKDWSAVARVAARRAGL